MLKGFSNPNLRELIDFIMAQTPDSERTEGSPFLGFE